MWGKSDYGILTFIYFSIFGVQYPRAIDFGKFGMNRSRCSKLHFTLYHKFDSDMIQTSHVDLATSPDIFGGFLSNDYWIIGRYPRSSKIRPLSGWWWLEPWNFMTFHSAGNFHPSQLTIRPSFFRGVGIAPSRLLLTIINHIITININLWLFNIAMENHQF